VRVLRRSALLLTALLLGLVPALAPAPVAAARPDLTLVGAATYVVLPEAGKVAVSVRLTATNHLRDTATRRYFFRTAFLSVLPGTSRFRISGGNGNPRVSVTSRTKTYTNLRIDLGADLAAGRSTTLTLTFDLKDPGGAPDRPLRISPSLLTFSAWAYATPDTPGASVVVRLPAGYDVLVGRGPLEGPELDDSGDLLLSSGSIASPLKFVADISADRAVERTETTRTVPLAAGPATVLLRAWPDDTAWRDRVGSLIERALPILEREIGIPWPVDGPLAVEEALVRGSGGYAGLFEPATGRIEISYAASDVVVLHELAHAWFNGSLVADRWAAEAFASYYADLTATELELEAAAPEPVEPGAEDVPLNAWGPSGSESPAVEAYGYSASFGLAQTIAQRAGPGGLQRVWALAARGVGAYRADPADPAVEEGGAAAPDWRGLLDLLEDETGAEFADLWRTWVVRPEDVAALEARAAARAAYQASVELAADWELPPSIREAMRAWRFDLAMEALAAADAVQAQRRTLEPAAAAAGLTLPDTLQAAFEGGADLGVAAAEASAEQATVDAIVAAAAARPVGSGIDDLIVRVGLIGTDPDASLAAAKAGLTAGELEPAYRSAQAAAAVWSGAADIGRSRMVSAALLVLALVLFLGLVRQSRQSRRKRAAEPG
jgi:hypothetical protein